MNNLFAQSEFDIRCEWGEQGVRAQRNHEQRVEARPDDGAAGAEGVGGRPGGGRHDDAVGAEAGQRPAVDRRRLRRQRPRRQVGRQLEVRPFLLPQFQPRLVRFTLDPASGRMRLTQQILLRDGDGDGVAEERHTLREGLSSPMGLGFEYLDGAASGAGRATNRSPIPSK